MLKSGKCHFSICQKEDYCILRLVFLHLSCNQVPVQLPLLYITILLIACLLSRSLHLCVIQWNDLFWDSEQSMSSAHLYVVRAIHHDGPVLLTVPVGSRLPQIFGLVPLPESRLCVWRQKKIQGGGGSASNKQR